MVSRLYQIVPGRKEIAGILRTRTSNVSSTSQKVS